MMFLQVHTLFQKNQAIGKWHNVFPDRKHKTLEDCEKWLKTFPKKQDTFVCLHGSLLPECPVTPFTVKDALSFIKEEKSKIKDKFVNISIVGYDSNKKEWCKKAYKDVELLEKISTEYYGRSVELFIFSSKEMTKKVSGFYISFVGKKKGNTYYPILIPSFTSKNTTTFEELLDKVKKAAELLQEIHEKGKRPFRHLFNKFTEKEAIEASDILLEFILSCPAYNKSTKQAAENFIHNLEKDNIKLLIENNKKRGKK